MDAGQYPLTIEGNDTNQIHLLGTYEMTTKANEKLNLKQEDFLSVQPAMYITLKSLPVQRYGIPHHRSNRHSFFHKIEVRGFKRTILYPGQVCTGKFKCICSFNKKNPA